MWNTALFNLSFFFKKHKTHNQMRGNNWVSFTHLVVSCYAEIQGRGNTECAQGLKACVQRHSFPGPLHVQWRPPPQKGGLDPDGHEEGKGTGR